MTVYLYDHLLSLNFVLFFTKTHSSKILAKARFSCTVHRSEIIHWSELKSVVLKFEKSPKIFVFLIGSVFEQCGLLIIFSFFYAINSGCNILWNFRLLRIVSNVVNYKHKLCNDFSIYCGLLMFRIFCKVVYYKNNESGKFKIQCELFINFDFCWILYKYNFVRIWHLQNLIFSHCLKYSALEHNTKTMYVINFKYNIDCF